MKIAIDRLGETDPETAAETMTAIIAAGAATEITEPGEMIHATAIAGAQMILLT
jgi:hypothetical protein